MQCTTSRAQSGHFHFGAMTDQSIAPLSYRNARSGVTGARDNPAGSIHDHMESMAAFQRHMVFHWGAGSQQQEQRAPFPVVGKQEAGSSRGVATTGGGAKRNNKLVGFLVLT